MAYLTNIGTAVPAHAYAQQALATRFAEALAADNPALARMIHAVYRKSGIAYRSSVLPDFSPDSSPTLFVDGLQAATPTAARMDAYAREAEPLALQAVAALGAAWNPEKITHLIAVTCTGLTAPGLEITLAQRLGLEPTVERHAVNFVGCYAALPALRLANALCAGNPHACVLVVCVELCTLHFQPATDPDNLLANALFADGAAACLVQTQPAPGALQLEGFVSCLIPQAKGDMAWRIGNTGFLMTLSSYIPDIIRADIRGLLTRALAVHRLDSDAIAHWAIHPGGKRILEACTQAFELPEDALRDSYEVLSRHGNMSSGTVLFVLEQLMRSGRARAGEIALAVAFGPGLTIEGALLRFA